MKILIIDIDSIILNLALKKIEKYHIDRGDEVIWNNELFAHIADRIYVSCIFDRNKNKAKSWEKFDNAVIGGTGYSLDIKLPKEIEKIKPRINLGFTTRGCIRKCKFCVVSQKEGKLRRADHIKDIWDGKSDTVELLDNNILADNEWFNINAKYIIKNKIKIIENGLDARLLNEENIKIIKQIRFKRVHFAFDDIKLKKIVIEKCKLLNEYKIEGLWYVLVGWNSTIEEDIERVKILVENKQKPYIMRHSNCGKDKRYIAISRWANSPILGKGTIPFEVYLNETKDGKSYKKYFNKVNNVYT